MSLEIEEKIKMIDGAFAHIIGQRDAVHAMKNSCKAYLHGGELGSNLLVAPAGTGKSALLLAKMTALNAIGLTNASVETPSSFRKVDSEDWSRVRNMIEGDSFYLAIDEAQELYDAKVFTQQTRKIASLAMRALDGNFRGGAIQLADDLTANFYRRKSGISLATNYPGKLPEALRSRAETITLSLYEEDELIKILTGMLSGYGLHARDEEILRIIARCGRGTARPMEQIARQLRRDLDAEGETKETISKKDIMMALRGLQMFPRGLSLVEMRVIAALATPMPQRVIMARFPNLDVTTWRHSSAYLLSLATSKGAPFLTYDKSAYKTTDAGLRFLASCKEENFRW